jgi:hypothetical protein
MSVIRNTYIKTNHVDKKFFENGNISELKTYILHLEDLYSDIMRKVIDVNFQDVLMLKNIRAIEKLIAETPGNHPILLEIYKYVQSVKEIEIKGAKNMATCLKHNQVYDPTKGESCVYCDKENKSSPNPTEKSGESKEGEPLHKHTDMQNGQNGN